MSLAKKIPANLRGDWVSAACFLVVQIFCSALAVGQSHGQPVRSWPHPVPCRIQDSANKDLWVMTLGDVQTPLAQGIFDPVKDEVKLNDGSIKTNYFRDTLGVKFYQPMDKSRYPLPPSGWCTWYFYYTRINANEVKLNTDWIAANLKEYGAHYVQIDDGWQGLTRPIGTRDWTHTNPERFPNGMADVAKHIKSRGLTAGLWIAPHGQSNPQVISNNPGLFLLKPDGTTASDTWEGKYLLDPTAPGAGRYMSDLFASFTGWGYDYFKIDGQPIVVEEYAKKKEFMRNPSDDAAGLYRETLRAIHSAIGSDRYLLGCWGIPIEGAGIMDGSRTGGDIVLGWEGFQVSLRATLQFYYLHNIVWYSDPDVLIVRAPLTLDQARVWAALQGLTGQALMSSDRLPDLSAERVELLKRVYPAVDIRPLDLFPVEENKRIWDLKVAHLDRHYDVVGVFNFTEGKSEQSFLRWGDLGLPANQRFHVFDFWNQEYLGAWETGMMVETSPTSCRVLTLLPDSGKIELLSTSRHITQGWVDLVWLSRSKSGNGFKGASKVVKGDPYALRFAFPRGTNCAVKSAKARGPGGKLPVKISNHQGWAAIEVTPVKSGEITWEVEFALADFYHYPPGGPEGLWVERVGLNSVNLRWQEQYYLNAGYQVYLNGALAGYTPSASFPLRGLDLQATNTVRVAAVWQDGVESQKKGELKFSVASLLPAEIALTSLEPANSARRRGFWSDETVTTEALNFGGERHEGLGALANSETEYELHGLFKTFSALAGVDQHTRSNSTVEFVIRGDGKELWRSGPMKKNDAPKPVSVEIQGVKRLLLRADGDSRSDTAGYRSRDHGGWAEPKLIRASATAAKSAE
jgi:NPCBM/NEW2 domain/Melibiase